jgi:hypothetical protein
VGTFIEHLVLKMRLLLADDFDKGRDEVVTIFVDDRNAVRAQLRSISRSFAPLRMTIST